MARAVHAILVFGATASCPKRLFCHWDVICNYRVVDEPEVRIQYFVILIVDDGDGQLFVSRKAANLTPMTVFLLLGVRLNRKY